MHRATIALTTMVLAIPAAIGAPAAIAAGHRALPKCPAAHQRLVAGDAQAVVYQGLAETQANGEIFGCSYATGHSTRLGAEPYGSAAGSGGVLPIALAGTIVAY